MARRKTITKDQILTAAYDIVATEGFSRFTARNIASKMKCSTQPIYLEFKNMDDLKEELFEKIEIYLRDVVFARVVTGDPLLDMNLNYVRFATDEKVLYRSLYLEGHSGEDMLNQFSHDLFMENINKDPELSLLDEEMKTAIFSGTWIVATGIASLKSGGLINPTDDNIKALLNDVITSVIKNEKNQILTKPVKGK
ncbi:TetR/AcrR family transcriptional regulator [uncultured Vagococcus sp.]|uniref:TetR/AcrR family transcriptional regulator n=1 Tax=uncultured Vagococcus sp. TaxID=189676 RepID=UPI0028D33D11|nr:TetR/AcrR family transcriptional regulator [uncultured Vagococcus sp.]